MLNRRYPNLPFGTTFYLKKMDKLADFTRYRKKAASPSLLARMTFRQFLSNTH